MTMARAHLVDSAVTRWYHCVTRCVRRAFLLGEGPAGNRKQWIEHRLKELAEIFAIVVSGFSVMDNHLHVLLRLDTDVATGWSDEDVVRRWGKLFPPRDKSRQPLPVTKAWVEWRLKDIAWVATARSRLQSLSWFMKCLKEPLARLANRQDQTRGECFKSRFKSVAILDDESLLATCTYIDLNPVARRHRSRPPGSKPPIYVDHHERTDHAKAQGRAGDLKQAERGSVAGSNSSVGLEESIWLCPIEDRRELDSAREGMLRGFSLGNDLLLVDYTGRLLREGKAAISAELTGILERARHKARKPGRPGSRN